MDDSRTRSPEIEDSVIDQPGSMLVFGRHVTRRDVIRLSGGIAGLAAIQAVLAACGDDDDDDGAAADQTEPPADEDQEPTEEPAGEDEETPEADDGDATPSTDDEPSPGADTEGVAVIVNAEGEPPDTPTGELRIALAFDPTSLDPIDTYTLNNGRWQSNVFSPLVWRDMNLVLYDGEGDNPSPSEGFGLAESWEYIDDLTLDMTLRAGVTFHNGEQFNAEAVKATFDRLLDEANQSPQRFNYTAIDSVEVIDDTTVRFHFNSVDPVMITKLAGYGAFITPPSALDNDEAFSTERAIGTGPYQVVEYVRDDRLVLEAWEDYWAGRPARIKTLRYRIIPDDNTRLSEFLAGSIDVLTMNVSQAEAAQGNPDLTVVDIGVPTVSGLRLDASKPPTDIREVRQAIAHAIDLQLIVDTILGGYARPVGIWQSPFSFGFEDIPPYEYNPDLARQLLEESGLETPVAVTYDIIGDDTQQREIAATVKDMLDAVGFEVEIRSQERATFFDDYRAGSLGNIVPFGWGAGRLTSTTPTTRCTTPASPTTPGTRTQKSTHYSTSSATHWIRRVVRRSPSRLTRSSMRTQSMSCCISRHTSGESITAFGTSPSHQMNASGGTTRG